MATQLWMLDSAATAHRGAQSNKADGTASGWRANYLSASRGTSTPNVATTNTVTGPTNGVEVLHASGLPFDWVSLPLDADVTISGDITLNLYMSESSMTANVGAQVIIERLDSQMNIASTILNSERGVELGTSISVQNWVATPTSTAMSKGDRIRVRVLGNDVGTMAAASTFAFDYDTSASGSDGDSYVQFTENLSFASSPSGTPFYLTSLVSDVNPGSANELMAVQAEPSSAVESVTDSQVGISWVTPMQITASAGGTAIEWFTPPLLPFTLGGRALVSIKAKQSAADAISSLRAEIAVCNEDGTNPVVWGAGCWLGGASNGDMSSSYAFRDADVAGDDVSVTEGQRLRLRIFIDDTAGVPMSAGHTVTVEYNGGNLSSYFILPQTVAERLFQRNVVAPSKAVQRAASW